DSLRQTTHIRLLVLRDAAEREARACKLRRERRRIGGDRDGGQASSRIVRDAGDRDVRSRRARGRLGHDLKRLTEICRGTKREPGRREGVQLLLIFADSHRPDPLKVWSKHRRRATRLPGWPSPPAASPL